MILKSLLFSSLSVLILIGCNRSPSGPGVVPVKGNKTELEGRLRGGAGMPVILEEMGAREYIPVDTVTCDSSGSFRIRFEAGDMAFYVLRYGSTGYVTLLLKPGESVFFSGEYGQKTHYLVEGSPGSVLLKELSEEHRKVLESLGEITRKNREWVGTPDYVKKKEVLDARFDSITREFYLFSEQFIHRHSDSPAILVALYNLYGPGLPVFDPLHDFRIYTFVDSALMATFSHLEAVQLLHTQVSEAAQLMKEGSSAVKPEPGQMAPDFVSSRPDGSPLALSDLKGQTVLLVFWAGWSTPCREENRVLRKAWEMHGKDNFRILQVSLDDRKEDWMEAIREDRLEWDHVSELSRWETPVVEMYGVERIPASVLIDPQGKILDTDLFGEELLNRLDDLEY